jgi:transcription elongation factor Elf1
MPEIKEEFITSIQCQEFLTDYEESVSLQLLEEGSKEENELFQIAKARGILLQDSRDLAGIKMVYTFADKANGNRARLPKKILLRALPGICGKSIDIDHNRSRVIGYYIDYKYIVKDESVIAYGIIFKSNFADEWKQAQALFRAGKLTCSYEIWCAKNKRKYLSDGTYLLTEMEIAGGAILFKTKPAFADAHVLEMAKINEEDMVYASKHFHPCEEMIIHGETICRKCGKCQEPEEAKIIGEPINVQLPSPITVSGKDSVGTKPVLVAPFAISDKEKPENKDVVGVKPRNNPPHSVASMDKEVECPKCAYKGIPNKKVVGDGTNTYTYACMKCGGLLDNISTPFSSVKCANCSYIIDKPFVTANEIKCPECKAILNEKGETKYPPQHIDFKMSCPACSSRNWRILKSDNKNADIKCMSCQRAYVISYQEDPKATVMSNLHFLHIGTAPCAQCGHRVGYAGTSKNNKYEVSCGECNLRFSHDITNEMVRRISSINEMTKADYETKYGAPTDLNTVTTPRVNSDPTVINKIDNYVHKAGLVEFNYPLSNGGEIVLEGKIINENPSGLNLYNLEVAGIEGIFIVSEKELISTADELIDKSANIIETEGEKDMEKKDVKPSAEIESPVEASIDDSYEDGFEVAKKLTYEQRQSLSDKDFAVVIHKDGKTIRKYPIKDPAHVRNALSRLGQEAPKAGLKSLGVSPESVRAKVLRRAKELNMHMNMNKADADSYDTDVMDDKNAEKVAEKLIKSHDDALFLQDKTLKEQKMAEEEEKLETIKEEKEETKENKNKASDEPTSILGVRGSKEKADLKGGKPDMNRNIANTENADLKKPVKDEKHTDVADLKTGKPDIDRTVADLKSGKPDMDRTVADLKSGKPDIDRTVADLKTGKPDMDRTVADLKTGKPDMNRNIAELKGYQVPLPGDDSDKLAEKLAQAKACIARHVASVKKAHKKLQEARKISKEKACEMHREMASQIEFYKVNAEEIGKRQREVGLEIASKISDRDILDNTKFADLKLEKANLEVATKGKVIGSKSEEAGDPNKDVRAEIDAKAFGRKARKT